MLNIHFRLSVFSRPFMAFFAAFFAALFLSACGKSTVRPVHADPTFALASLRADSTVLVITGDARIEGFRKQFEEAFGTGDSMASYLSARILDSLTRGNVALRIAAASPQVTALFPQDSSASVALPDTGWTGVTGGIAYIVRVHNVKVEYVKKDVPSALLPSGGQSAMVPAGGGVSENCVVTLDAEVWDTATLTRRYAFTVTGGASVLLYAYKSALMEAVNAAARRTAWHLRGE